MYFSLLQAVICPVLNRGRQQIINAQKTYSTFCGSCVNLFLVWEPGEQSAVTALEETDILRL